MHDSDRFRLLGSYETPLFEYGDVVFCERLGEVEIVGLTDSRIPWPTGKRQGLSKPAMILFDALAEAVRRESNIAVCHWWGVTPQTVTKWRKALEVPATTEGTSRLHSDYCQEPETAGLKKGVTKARDPERRRKIADAKRGKPRPKHVLETLRAANVGRKLSQDQREKMSEAHKRRGTIPPKAGRLWTAAEDEAVLMLSADDAAARTGRTIRAIYTRRNRLGVPDARRQDRRKRHQKLAR